MYLSNNITEKILAETQCVCIIVESEQKHNKLLKQSII